MYPKDKGDLTMFITDKNELKKYYAENRIWQGIPSIEVTPKGRIFVTFYSGGIKEEIGNYSILIVSDDGGKTFTEPVAVVYEEGHRHFDPCLWIDPVGRLWLTYTKFPDDGLYAVICNDPDADELVFGEEFFIGHDVMMNKPIIMKNGNWALPIAVWDWRLAENFPGFGMDNPDKGSFVYTSSDNGKTFVKRGCTRIEDRSFDEHMLLEMNDGTLRMFVRGEHGVIYASDSHDGGDTWSDGFDSGYRGPTSRFHITRLKSGRILFVNHYDFAERDHLYAMLSEDGGKTFPYKLLIDERKDVSYPDAKEAEDGFIYITYDRERGGYKKSYAEAKECAREILVAKITEDDILKGSIQNPESYLERVASKLSEYNGDAEALYN